MTSPEMNLLNNNNARNTGQVYWLASPYYFYIDNTLGRYVTSAGNLYGSGYVSNTYDARPAVSLTPGIEFTGGDGTKASPYIINIGA